VNGLAIREQHHAQVSAVHLGNACPSANATIGLDRLSYGRLDCALDPAVEYPSAIRASSDIKKVCRELHVRMEENSRMSRPNDRDYRPATGGDPRCCRSGALRGWASPFSACSMISCAYLSAVFPTSSTESRTVVVIALQQVHLFEISTKLISRATGSDLKLILKCETPFLSTRISSESVLHSR
jgi:hypothetical protein